uniref:CSON010351 protein n=1 Tax=Culicoides sonorensis TaxID=179676 RepID=A0A336MDN1_CULSO
MSCPILDEILLECPEAHLIIHKLDLSSLKSVREFASVIVNTEQKIDVLLHNAGVGGAVFKNFTTEDNLELVMETNYFGPFLLTHLLINLLKQSAPSRIVVVSSVLHKAWPCNSNNLKGKALPFFQYCKSKCAGIRFTLELAKRLKGTGVTANCLHPGVINTGIWRNVGLPASLFVNMIRPCMKTVDEGVLTNMYCVTAEELQNVNGKYFVDCKETALAKRIEDSKLNEELWEATKIIVQLKETDPKI